jgi:polar amino acid transport system permease protein
MDFFLKFYEYLPDFLDGLWLTTLLTIVSAIGGFLLAVPIVIGSLYGNRFFRLLCITYITIIRGTPMLVQLFFIYYGLPASGLRLAPLTAAIIGFVINSAAYQAEYLKGGILAITTDQVEAGHAIGLSKWQVIQYIIFPQGLRFSIPALSNEIIYLLQYTSAAFIIQVPELFGQAKYFASDTYYYLEIFFLIGAVYLLMIYLVTVLTNYTEKKLYIPGFEVSHLR